MTSKSFRTDQNLSITPTMEKSVARAFDEFVPKQAAPKMYSGVLNRRNNPHACRHIWKATSDLPKEHADYLQAITEEKPEPGATKWCANCGAVSYWESGELWLYDATTRFFGRPPKRKHR